MILLSQVAAFALSLAYVPLMVMWGKFTPKKEMSFWSVLTQCARQGGFLVGPAVFALLSLAVKRSQPMAPPSLMAWVLLAQAMFGLLSALVNSMILPLAVSGVSPPDDDTEDTLFSPNAVDTERVELPVECLELSKRQKVVQGMLFYAFERQFVVTSIEVSTIMLLEVSYHWSVELSGTIFTAVSTSSLSFVFISSALMSKQVFQESMVFMACNCIALLGVIFLFDFRQLGAFGLLLADALVYGCATVSNGLAEGWASRAAEEKTDFSTEVYRTWNMALVCGARSLAPTVARSLLDYGGRNVYAALQLVMVALGTLTVYKTVALVWELNSAPLNHKKPAEKLS
ncbi:unnamed protein product [Durusdinium trenchii]